MTKLTQSLTQWLFENHPTKLCKIMFGASYLMTQDMWQSYLAWCQTPDGKSWLKGGENYREEYE